MAAAITLPVEIAGQTFQLVFKFGTIRAFERQLGQTMAEAFGARPGMTKAEQERAGQAITMDTWAALFWAVLQPHHPMTAEASDDLVDTAGLQQVILWCGKGLEAYNAGDPALAEKGQPAGEAKAAAAG